MTQPSNGLFVVLNGEGAHNYADCPIVVDIADPDGLLGRIPIICLRRSGRVPCKLTRSVLLDRNGRGRFYGWTPASLCGLEIQPGDQAASVGCKPEIRVRKVTLAKLAILVALKSPKAASQSLKLLLTKNLKGFNFRFARLYDSLNEPSYAAWTSSRLEMERSVSGHSAIPTLPVFVSIVGDPGLAAATHQSIVRQSYPHVQEVPVGLVRMIAARSQEPALWMRLQAGTQLHHTAIERLIQPLAADRSLAAAYSDEDRIDGRGRRFAPFFKPAWNSPLAETGWLSADGALIQLHALPSEVDLEHTGSGSLLLAAARHGQIVHVPRVLLHRTAPRSPASPSMPRIARAKTKVSIVIPTRDRADLLSACLRGLFEGTRAHDLDVIVIDNDSREPETLALFAQYEANRRINRIILPGSFNFARACNLGAANARHELVLLLNNDVEPLDPGWLDQMVAELDDSRIGAAGALLLFPDGYAQHAGVTLGSGSVARHSFHFRKPGAGEDFGLLAQRQEVSAVTAACLLTRRSLWAAVGGMNEDQLPVAFNDVDYCLKLRELGKGVMWTPHARLVHHESVSRGSDNTPEKLARFAAEEKYMHERWGTVLQNDPFYNPNLSLTAGDRVLEAQPRDLSPRLAGMPSRVRQTPEAQDAPPGS